MIRQFAKSIWHGHTRRLSIFPILFGFFASILMGYSPSMAPFPSFPGNDTWESRPNDPGYETAWQLFSHPPKNHTGDLSNFEQSIGSGNHVDVAWQYHTGTPSTVIGVFDTGIYWDSEDLIDQIFLNTRELPLPAGSALYDKNSDGKATVADYVDDPRVGDRNQNGIIDVEDLILAFSDGVDDDRNGFVDDIAGWDFHEHDNNAGDRTEFGHGTGEAKGSVSAINNGKGTAGVCGNCRFVPIRINDSFVIDSNAFARALIYATDLGVNVIQAASGALNTNPFVKEAVEYANRHGVVIVGSAADENSFHNNQPHSLDPILYVNSIRYDTPKFQDATTFLNFNNCSNYGARVDVSAASLACSSEATAMLSGVVALTQSYANALGIALSVGENIALIKTSATDIALGPAPSDSTRHPSYLGWDSTTGYGRLDAGKMLKRIHDHEIPPEARIKTPEWFAVYRKSTTPTIEVEIEANSSNGSVTAELLAYRGVEAAGATPQALAEPTGPSGPDVEQKTKFKISIDALLRLPTNTLDHKRYANAFTILLRVHNLGAQNIVSSSEARRTIFIFDDPNLRQGFPVKLGASGESSGVFFDLLKDGQKQYICGDGGGFIHAIDSFGQELKGFPVGAARSRYQPEEGRGFAPVYSSVHGPIAIGDLAGNGQNAIVAVTAEGQITAIHDNGSVFDGFPVTLAFPDMNAASKDQVIAQGILGSPVLYDIDGDGTLEIITVQLDGTISVLRHDGSPQPGFPLAIEYQGYRAKIVSSPAIFDINGDGTPDLVFGTNHINSGTGLLFAVNGRGNLAANPVLTGFPTMIPLLKPDLLPVIGTGLAAAPAIGDIDGDGRKEIVVHGFASKTYVLGFDGKIKRSLSMDFNTNLTGPIPPSSPTTVDTMISGFGQPALGDVDGDGILDPVTLGAGRKILVSMAVGGKRVPYDHLVGAWNGKTGIMIAGYPRANDDVQIYPSPVFADLGNTRHSAIIVGSGGYYLHAFDGIDEVEGFPKFTGGWILGAASVADMDGDGLLDVGATTREGYLFVWKTKGDAKSPKNKTGIGMTFKANPHRTGIWE